jgi:hypothetical protein
LAHLQAAQADTQTQACKRANSPTRHRTRMTVKRVKNRILTDKKLYLIKKWQIKTQSK